GIWVLEEFVDLAEPRTPQVLELRQKITRPGKLFRVPTDPAFTAVRSFDHETCLLQYRHVLLHRCKRHVVARGEGRHRRLLPCKYAPDDVAARGVGECAEQAVELRVGQVSMTYNHMVVDNGRGRAGKWGGMRQGVDRQGTREPLPNFLRIVWTCVRLPRSWMCLLRYREPSSAAASAGSTRPSVPSTFTTATSSARVGPRLTTAMGSPSRVARSMKRRPE